MVLICVDVSFYIYTTLKKQFHGTNFEFIDTGIFLKIHTKYIVSDKKMFSRENYSFFTWYLFQTAYINLTKICNSLNWDIFKVSNFNNRDENSQYFDFFFYLVNNNFKSTYFGVNIVNLTVPYIQFEYFSKMIEIYINILT